MRSCRNWGIAMSARHATALSWPTQMGAPTADAIPPPNPSTRFWRRNLRPKNPTPPKRESRTNQPQRAFVQSLKSILQTKNPWIYPGIFYFKIVLMPTEQVASVSENPPPTDIGQGRPPLLGQSPKGKRLFGRTKRRRRFCLRVPSLGWQRDLHRRWHDSHHHDRSRLDRHRLMSRSPILAETQEDENTQKKVLHRPASFPLLRGRRYTTLFS